MGGGHPRGLSSRVGSLARQHQPALAPWAVSRPNSAGNSPVSVFPLRVALGTVGGPESPPEG